MKATDIIVVLITVTLCVCLTFVVGSAVYNGDRYKDRLDVVAGVASSMLSIISMFIGAKIQQHIYNGEQK